jgi:hypothetical protein
LSRLDLPDPIPPVIAILGTLPILLIIIIIA